MSLVILNMSMSLDGFVAGADVRENEPMGDHGERLHDWIMTPDAIDTEVSERHQATIGALVIGRRMFDLGLRHWGGTPYPRPTFVVTHEARPDLATPTGTFTFVTDGVAAAVAKARAVAGERDVVVMGGAEVARQALRAGLIDELRLQLVPVLLGAGARLFEDVGQAPLAFEQREAIASSSVVHLRYGVGRNGADPAVAVDAVQEERA